MFKILLPWIIAFRIKTLPAAISPVLVGTALAYKISNDFNLDPKNVNIYGGAISLGHPIGASGARIITTLINGMKKNNAELGLAVICIGGGEASAVIIKNV